MGDYGWHTRLWDGTEVELIVRGDAGQRQLTMFEAMANLVRSLEEEYQQQVAKPVLSRAEAADAYGAARLPYEASLRKYALCRSLENETEMKANRRIRDEAWRAYLDAVAREGSEAND